MKHKSKHIVDSDNQLQHWLFVTRPDYYANPDGSDRDDLDPDFAGDADGWWTCHSNTRRGDHILLYRTTPRQDIAYLLRAVSDAYSLSNDDYALDMGWDYGCEYVVDAKFDNPLPLATMRKDPYISDWGAFRGNFQRRVYSIPDEIWHHLIDHLSKTNPKFRKTAKRLDQNIAPTTIVLESQLEQHIVDNPECLKPLGYDCEILYRQMVCSGHGGRVDLLAFDRKRNAYVVIELKNVRAGQNTFGQVSTYMGWVAANFPRRKKVHGLVIARGFDNRFLTAAATNPNVAFQDIESLGVQ